MIADKPELQVERDVLVQMPGRRVRFGAEDRAELEDPLVDTDHDLLVELRRLCEICRTVEVGDREDVGPAFRGRANDLRREDLDKTTVFEFRVKRSGDRSHNARYRLFGGMAQRK